MMRSRFLASAIVVLLEAGCSPFQDKPPGQPDASTTDGPAPSDTSSPGDSASKDRGPQPDLGALIWPKPPADWNPDGTKLPKYTHLTWQRDPATTTTFQWRTSAKSGYTPMAWLAPADLVKGSGTSAQLPYIEWLVFKGAGEPVGNDMQWTVEATGLKPNTRYYYRVGTWTSFDKASSSFKDPNLSDASSYRTGVSKGDTTSFTFVAAGDSRSGNTAIKANASRLATIDAQLWLFSGDMTNMGTIQEWDGWFMAMGAILRGRILMPVQGNHETVANLYYSQFALPRHTSLPPEYVEHNWSIDFGNVHFVGLDSNTDATVKGAVQWLGQDLAAAAADPKTTWKVVCFHHPAYSASPVHGSTTRVISSWVPLFEKHGVDLAFAGHDHDYERSHPVNGSQKAAPGQGVVYIVAGGFYAPGYAAGKDWWTVTSAHGNIGNYVVAQVAGKKMTIQAYSGDGTQVLDSFTLTKP